MALTDTDPVAIRIAQQIVSTLQAISAGDDYYHNMRHVELSRGGWFNPPVYPACVVIPRTVNVDVPGESLTDSAVFDHDFQITAVIEYRTDAAEELYKLYADIHHAIMADVTRGELAESTRVVLWESLVPVDEADQLSELDILIRVRFRTEQADLTTAV